MSRGGRGGGRGGRRGGMPWPDDPTMKADSRPVELFPEYNVPQAAPLSAQERRVVDYFLLVREQIHSSPLYTQTRTFKAGGGGGGGERIGRVYGQDQLNQQYGVRNKATVDPFVAVPMYSHRLEKAERALPDLAKRPFNKELFPQELWPTLDGVDNLGGRRPGALAAARAGRKVLALSEVTALRSAEDIFQQQRKQEAADGAGEGPDDGGGDTRKALEQLEKFGNADLDNEDNVEFGLVEDEGDYEDVEDEAYDDDEEGDYNAEAAFDNGDDDYGDDDFGDDGGGDEGVF